MDVRLKSRPNLPLIQNPVTHDCIVGHGKLEGMRKIAYSHGVEIT